MERVRIGVTGHRVLTDLGRVQAGVHAALHLILRTRGTSHLTIVSALAEGADRIVVEEALRKYDARLEVVLPFASETYAADFGPASRAHFARLLAGADTVRVVPPTPTRDDAYAAAGMRVLETSDVLLAIWDGEPSQGRGGTGDIVERARALGKPLVVVRAGNRSPATGQPTSLGDAQGQVLAERL